MYDQLAVSSFDAATFQSMHCLLCGVGAVWAAPVLIGTQRKADSAATSWTCIQARARERGREVLGEVTE
eukprot:366508-Chlamydomonas_euryale.AAC.9